MKKDIETYKNFSLIVRVAFISIFLTTLLIGTIILWGSSTIISSTPNQSSFSESVRDIEFVDQKEGNNDVDVVTEIVEDIIFDDVVYLPNTFYGSNIEISYPEGWSVLADESGGLTEIIEPDENLSVLYVEYIDARVGDIVDCEGPGLAHGRPTTLGVNVTEGGYETSLLRYQGINKLGLTEIKIVLLEGVKDGEINRCSIFNFENPWTPDNLVVTRIAESMALNFVGEGRGE